MILVEAQTYLYSSKEYLLYSQKMIKLTMAVHMLKTVEEDIPKYKTREMRRVFQKQINNLRSVNILKHILRYCIAH